MGTRISCTFVFLHQTLEGARGHATTGWRGTIGKHHDTLLLLVAILQLTRVRMIARISRFSRISRILHLKDVLKFGYTIVKFYSPNY